MGMSFPLLPGGLQHQVGAILSQDSIEWAGVVFKDPPAIGTTLCALLFPRSTPRCGDSEWIMKNCRSSSGLAMTCISNSFSSCDSDANLPRDQKPFHEGLSHNPHP